MTQEPKLYEIAYVFNATSEETARTAAVEQVKKYIEERNGRSFEESRQMRRRLAYPIGKNHEGFFGNIKFFLKPEDIKELEGRLKLEGCLIRYMLSAVSRSTRDSGTGPKRPRRIPEKKAADIKEIDKKLEEILGK